MPTTLEETRRHMLSALTNIEDLQSSTCSFDRGNSLSYISVSLKFASRSPLGDHLKFKDPIRRTINHSIVGKSARSLFCSL